ncbi:MAG TPA: hypothetical protein VKQ32_01960 [Polyangia bacterium]|nr:hypothetical protein [Polyangia bacterium]
MVSQSAVHWSINSYPSLAGRPRDERQAILRAALKQHGRVYGLRLLIVIAGVVIGAIAASARLSPHPRLQDWRTWIVPVAGALFIYGYLLLEINGAVHTAVKKYLADRDAPPRRKRT